MAIPLAERLRPTTLDNYIGQKHLVGKDQLREAVVMMLRKTPKYIGMELHSKAVLCSL